MRLYSALLLLAAPIAVHATVNMPLVCPIAVVSGKCNVASTPVQPGKNGLYVATPEGVWKEWSTLTATSLVRVCPSDVAPGTVCPVSRISVTKAQAAIDSTWAAVYTWVPPTLDTKGATLPSGEVTGYIFSWRYFVDSTFTDVNLGAVTSYRLAGLLPKVVCAKLVAKGKSNNSDPTIEWCIDPQAPTTAITPGVPKDFRGVKEP